MNAIDLFAGPGGWDVAAHALGIEPLGIEHDDAACATREAAGLRTHQADVSALDPSEFGPCDLLIGSPPCPTFSAAGKGGGRHLTDVILRCMGEVAGGRDTRPERRAEAEAILQPVYWRAEQKTAKDRKRQPDRVKSDERARRDAVMSILVVEPLRWIVSLRPGRVACEQVPAVLPLWNVMAQLLHALGYSTWAGVLEAERYGVPQTRERAVLMASRVEAVHPPAPTHQRYVFGEPARHEMTFDGELLPWVSMADALGWGMTERPAFTAAFGHDPGGSGGSGARKLMRRARDSPAWVQRERSGDRAEEGFDASEMPCQTITSKARSWTLHRPATTIACDPRVFQPGGHHQPGQQSENSITLTPSEAGVVQSFPADYPWHGSRTKQFEQIGNAVPPLLAFRILESLLA